MVMAWGRGESGNDWICDNLEIEPKRYEWGGGKAKEKYQAKFLGLMTVLITR